MAVSDQGRRGPVADLAGTERIASHTMPQWDRTVEIDGVARPYLDLFGWTGPAGAGYLPATVVPAGLGDDGLPIGVQIVGPYLHDRTTLRAAALIAKLAGGCPRPVLAN